MGEFQIIESALEGAAGRRRWAKALRGLWRGLLVGAVLSLLLVGAYHLWPLPLWFPLAASLVPLPCMAAGLIIGGWRKPARTEVARWIDRQQGLKERLSTALEVAADPNSGAWGSLVVADAAEHAKGLDPRRLVPFRLPKQATRWALVVLALVVGLGFVPEYRSKRFLQARNDQQVIKQTGRQLADLTRRNLQRRPPTFEPTQKAMESISDLGEQLAKTPLTRSEALKDLANAADKLKDQLKELGKDPTFKRLEQAARASAGTDSQNGTGLQKQIEEMQKKLGTPTGNPEALDQLRKDLEKIEEAAKGLSDKNTLSNNEAERQKLSAALSALSKQAAEMGLQQMPQLDEAIKALEANQTDLFLKDLKASVTDLQKLRDMAKTLQQLQLQMEQVGKTLAEQLKNGQPEVAQKTLEKMAEQLQAGKLTPEQLQKMAQEIAAAVKPAGSYGKVADHLQKAGQQMQGGDKSGSSQSLAAAAKELEKLAQQLADAQSLSSELDALNQAEMAVGGAKGWRMGRPRAGRTQKFGSGVGDWGDDSAEWDGQFTEHWDNTGIVRPDTDSRGQTDRGEGELNDALKPTKVRGQFTPGGQMPSITLKNVSIKGQSKVEYESAAAAAQSDAESALSQEKVPRAYQGTVKDYFDDLKK